MAPVVAFAVAAAPVAAVVVGTMSVIESREARKEAKSQGKESRLQREREMQMQEFQAGEYYDLSRQQMELQSQASQIKTLSNLIEERRQPVQQQIITLPPAKSYTAVERFNQAIDDLVKG